MSTSCPKEGGHTTLVNKVMLSNKLSSFKRPFFNAAFKKDNDNTSSYRCCESNGGHCSGGGGGWVPKSGTGCRHVVRQLSKIITIVKKSQVSKNHKCQTPQVSNTTKTTSSRTGCGTTCHCVAGIARTPCIHVVAQEGRGCGQTSFGGGSSFHQLHRCLSKQCHNVAAFVLLPVFNAFFAGVVELFFCLQRPRFVCTTMHNSNKNNRVSANDQ